MNIKSLALTVSIAASFGATTLLADEPKPEARREAAPEPERKPEAGAPRRPEAGAERRPEGGPGRFFPGGDALTQEEREKLRAAQAKASQDPNVQAAEAGMRDAMKAL